MHQCFEQSQSGYKDELENQLDWEAASVTFLGKLGFQGVAIPQYSVLPIMYI
jgi:hypothetical protein